MVASVQQHCTTANAIGNANLPDDTKAKILRGVPGIVAVFNRMDVGVLEICFGNYAEHVTLALLGEQTVGPFLLQCF